MSMPKEHDYIGLSETSSLERVSDKLSSSSSSSSISEHNKNSKPNTSLRLGLPGSHSPERKPVLPALSLFGKDINETTSDTANGYCLSPFKNLVSGNKRGFSDAIDGKWVLSACNGSEGELGKGGMLFSPRSDNSATQKSSVSGTGKKDVVECVQVKTSQVSAANDNNTAPAAKAQVVGWPPIRSFRKNSMATNLAKNNDDAEAKSGLGCLYLKVSMDGAPYLRKIDLKTYTNYTELSSALEKMFCCFTIGQCGSHGLPGKDGLSETCLKDLLHSSENVLTYEDKDGDWMLVGDVPWEMFTESCRRLRIMKGSEAIGLAPRAMEKCKNRN